MRINALIKQKIKQLNLLAFEYATRYKWMKWAHNKMLNRQTPLKPLTRVQKEKIRLRWGKKYAVSKSFLIYNQFPNVHNIEDYVPSEFFLFRMDPFFNKVLECKTVDNKNFYDLLFGDVKQPKTIARQINGIYLDADYNIIEKRDVIKLCSAEKEVIIKAATESLGGHGISFWSPEEDTESLTDRIGDGNNMLIESVICQHPAMASLNAKSLNTIRIVTLFLNGEVHIITQLVRMGCGELRVDNASSGGMYCGINPDGTLMEYGHYDYPTESYKKHPNGFVFKGFAIPNYHKCIDLVKRLSPRMSYIANLIAWDLSIDIDGDPVLIETNLAYSDPLFCQVASGPMLGNGQLLNHILKIIPVK